MYIGGRWSLTSFCAIIELMDSKTLLRAGGIGAAAMVYIAILIFRFDIFSPLTLFFMVLGAAVGILVAYKVRFG